MTGLALRQRSAWLNLRQNMSFTSHLIKFLIKCRYFDISILVLNRKWGSDTPFINESPINFIFKE